jgi:hypothetical protein
MANPEAEVLMGVLLRRYPAEEWATFARFGWRETPYGLVLTLAALDLPQEGDLNPNVPHVAIDEQYTLRVALEAERHNLAMGVVHSHPEGAWTSPSTVDDDMDRYYAEYFADFAPHRPYVSLIFARCGQTTSATGRVFWNGQWHNVGRFVMEGHHVVLRTYQPPKRLKPDAQARIARLRSAFGEEAAERLTAATVGVVGASGTGSPAVEVLARAGVGRIIVVDPDFFTDSNLERVHGSEAGDVVSAAAKAALARRHIESINPECQVIALRGALPQPEVVDALVTADVVLGCTDQQHSRLALSDLALRYLVPVLDVGVGLEGGSGLMTGLIIQLVRMLPADPCVLCRGMTDPQRIAQELMTADEQDARRRAAAEARERGEPWGQYWRELPQLNTVGFLTTTAAAMAAGYAIGWLSGRYNPPFEKLQMNLLAIDLDVTDLNEKPRPGCTCRRVRGMADQAAAHALITAPAHWPPVQPVESARFPARM